jgi:hypothetical protein
MGGEEYIRVGHALGIIIVFILPLFQGMRQYKTLKAWWYVSLERHGATVEGCMYCQCHTKLISLLVHVDLTYYEKTPPYHCFK